MDGSTSYDRRAWHLLSEKNWKIIEWKNYCISKSTHRGVKLEILRNNYGLFNYCLCRCKKNLPFSELYWTSLLSLLGHAQSLALVPPALPLLISTIFNMVFIHFYNKMLVGFKECLFKFKFNSFDHDFVMNHCAFIHNWIAENL